MAAGSRERKKAATRDALRQHAIRLFLERGFEATPVADIAAAAGVSQMTFFRYFPTKQHVVDDESGDDRLLAALAARPADESPVEAVRGAALQAVAGADEDPAELLARTRLILGSVTLRAWLWERHCERERAVAAALLDRDQGLDPRSARVVAAACVATLGAAMAEWASADGYDRTT